MKNDPFSKNAKSIRFKALCFTLAIHLMVLGSVVYSSGGGTPTDLLPDLPDFVKEYFEGDKEEVKPEKKEKKKSKKPQA